MNKILCSILTAISVYLAFGFFFLSFDPYVWGHVGRFLFIIFAPYFSVMAYVFTGETQ